MPAVFAISCGVDDLHWRRTYGEKIVWRSPAAHEPQELVDTQGEGESWSEGMLIGYFDESGLDEKSKVFWFSGYIASSWEWWDFCRAWKSELARHGVERLHMTDFVARVGEYKNWSEEKRYDFLTGLILIIHSMEVYGFGAGVVRADYQRVFVESDFIERQGMTREWWGEPFALAFQHCIVQVAVHAEDLPQGEKIAFVLHELGTYRGRLTAIYRGMQEDPRWERRHRLGSLEFRSDMDSVPLQAADLLAYEMRKGHDRRIANPDAKIRASMDRLRKRLMYNGYFDAATIEAFMRTYPERPPGPP